MKQLLKHLSLSLNLTALILMAACTKEVRRTVHEQPVDTRVKADDKEASVESELAISEADDSLQAFRSLNQTEVYESMKAAKSKGDFEALINKISPTILSSAQMRRPEVVSSEKFRLTLGYLNFSAIKLNEADPKSPALKEFLDKYQKLVMEGCTAELTQCQNIRIFASDLRSSQVIGLKIEQMKPAITALKTSKDTAKLDEQLHIYYRLLGVAYDLKNKQKDQALDFNYMLFARSYADCLGRINTPASMEQLRRHGRAFQNILESYPIDTKSESFRSFLLDFQPWTYSRAQAGIFPYGTKELFGAAAKVLLYDEHGQLSKGFKEALQKIQSENDNSGPSVRQTVNTLNSTVGKKLRAFGLPIDKMMQDSFYNEYFFIIDRLFRGHLSTEEAVQIWNVTKRDVNVLADTYQAYLKLSLISTLFYTNQEMKTIYNMNASNSDQMFNIVISNSQYISNRWGQNLNIAQMVGTFVIEQVSKESGDQARSEDVNKLLNSIDRNLKYSSVFPHEMLMTYLMAEKNMNVTYQTWWGAEIKIDSATIIDLLFQGALTSWFRFGNSTSDGISKFELNYAFHYAIISGIFDSFAGIKKSDGSPVLDYASFVKTMLQRYLTNEIDTLNKANIELAEFTNSGEFNNALRFCEAQSIAKKNGSVDGNYILPIEDMMSLKTTVFTGVGDDSTHGVSGSMQKVYSDLVFGIFQSINNIRYSITPKLTQMKLLEDVLVLNQNSLSENAEDTKTYLKLIRDEIKSVEDREIAYYNKAVSLHKTISQCQNEAVAMEMKIRYDYLDHEINRLGKVYDAYMEAAKAGAINAEGLKAINANPQFGMLKGMEEVNASVYYYNELNFYVRLAEWLSTIKPIPVRVNLPTETFERLSSYSKRFGIDFRDQSGQFISRNQFIKNALLRINGSTESFVAWTEKMVGVASKLSKIDALSSLYRLGIDLKQEPKNRISSEEIFAEIKDLLTKSNITEKDKEILTWLSRNRKISAEELKYIFPIENDPKSTPLENIYSKITVNGEGSNDLILNEALNFYGFHILNWTYIFPPPPEIDQRIRSYFIPLIANTEFAKADTEKVLFQMESQETPPWGSGDFVFRLENGQTAASWAPARFTNSNGRNQYILLSRERGLNKLTNNLDTFHSKTKNYFKPNSVDVSEKVNRTKTDGK